MVPRSLVFGLMLLGLLSAICDSSNAAGTNAPTGFTPSVNRKFFLSAAPSNLTLNTPGNDLKPQNITFSGRPLVFVDQQVLFPPPLASISGTLTFSLWLSSNNTKGARVSLSGIFRESLSNGVLTLLSSSQNATVSTVPSPVNVTLSGSEPLLVGSQLSASISAMPLNAANTTITLSWGSSQTPSYIQVPMSGYEALLGANPVQIFGALTSATSFNVSATFPNNVVIFLVQVAFTFSEDNQYGKVNLTIADPSFNPVKQATNLSMTKSLISTTTSTYTTDWVYPNNSTTGVYQINLDVIDSQNNVASSLKEVASFSLFRPNPLLTTTLNVLPYAAVGGAGVVGVAVYYRRRKTKSYLVPFDYFNTMTGGELNGGTLVAVEGNTGSGKSLLSEQMMFEDLKKGTPCVFVTTSDFPASIRTGMSMMNFDVTGYEKNGLLTFVDSYSAEAGKESSEKYSVSSAGDLTSLGVKISSSLPMTSKGTSLYFDSLTPLASKAKPETIISFVQSVSARVRGIGGKAVFTFGPSMDGMIRQQLEEMADCVVQMEAFEEGGMRRRRLRIAKLRSRSHVESWAVFGIEAGRGIIFYSKKPRT